MARGDKAAGADSLTLLTTTGGILAVKTFRRGDGGGIEEEGYGRARTFTAREIDVDGDGEWLRALGPKQQSFVVLGRPVDWRPGERKRRLSSDRDGDSATIEDCARSWMPVDVDKIGFESLAAVDDGETLALETLSWLGLRGRRCVWHLTNSHGFKGKVRIRLWVRLARPATAEQMKAFARFRWKDDQVDVSVYRPAQPIYTGDPKLVGVDDPVTERVGTLEGEPLEMGKIRVARRRANEVPDDPNIALLQEKGYYIDQLRPGQHAIRCPWESEHTDQTERDDDTFYFEPHFNGHDRPAFKCHHGHCDQRTWEDALMELGGDRPVRSTRSSFQMDDAERDAVGEPTGGDGPGESRGGLGRWAYILRRRRFVDPRDGQLISRETFDDTIGSGKTRDGTPSDRFLKKPSNPRFDECEFLPGEPVETVRGEISVLNTYVDLRVRPDPKGEWSFFEDHLAWLVQDPAEREILSRWLAWVYRHPERKVTYAVVLCGDPGVGKSSVFEVLAACIGGDAQVSRPHQSQIENRFNGWAFGKRLVIIPELMSDDRYSIAEKLKTVVADRTISIERKNEEPFDVRNVASVCACTNHPDPIAIGRGDRRYAFIECRSAASARRGRHMRDFHRNLETYGYGGIAHWLNEVVDLTGFKPESEAPMTALKQVIEEMTMTDLSRAIEASSVFDREPVVIGTALLEWLDEQGIKLNEKKLGMIARKRRWARLEERIVYQRRRVTLWSPTGDLAGLYKIAALDAPARGARLQQISNRIASPGTWTKGDAPTEIY